MYPSYRFRIRNLWDMERLITAIGTCPDLLPGSLELGHGYESLAEQLASEHRGHDLDRLRHTSTPGGMIALFRCLWNRPLAGGGKYTVHIEGRLASSPEQHISACVDIPTLDMQPCWVSLEFGNEMASRVCLESVYRSLSMASGLSLHEQPAY